MFKEDGKFASGSLASECIRNFLEKEPIAGIANENLYVKELLPAITLSEVNRAIRAELPARAHRLIAFMGSSKIPGLVPTEAQLLAAVAEGEKQVVTPREKVEGGDTLMATRPAAGKIVSETSDAALGIIKLGLSNGVNVILKPTDFKNDNIVLYASRFGGDSLYEQNDLLMARESAAVVRAMGVGSLSPMALRRVNAGRNFLISNGGIEYEDRFTGFSAQEDLEIALQKLYLTVTQPRKDKALFESFISRNKEAVSKTMASPAWRLDELHYATVNHNDPRKKSPSSEDFEHMDLDRTLEIYQERFGNVKGFTFVLAGNFEPGKIKPLIETYIASLPVTDMAPFYKDRSVRSEKAVVKNAINAGIENKSTVKLTFSGDATYSLQEENRLAALIDVLNLKITDVLRTKLQLIYTGSASGVLLRAPTSGYRIFVNLPCSPDNVDKVIAALLAEIENIKANGPDASELEKIKLNAIQMHQKSIRTNQFWSLVLANAALRGDDMASILTFDDRFNAITAGQIKKAAQTYFDMSNYVQTVSYPEKAATAAP